MKTFTLYGLRKPGEEARYIGITSQSLKRRVNAHLREEGGNLHKKAWIAKMFREENVSPEIIPYCVGLSFEAAEQLEISVIAELRNQKFDLVNLAAGGGGSTGHRLSENQKEKISVSLRGNKRALGKNLGNKYGRKNLGNKNALGFRHSEETKEEMRLASLGNKHALGFKHSDESRKTMSESRKGRVTSPETRQKITEVNLLRWEKYRQERVLAEMWR